MILSLMLIAPLMAGEPELGFVFLGDTGTGGPAQQRVASLLGEFCATQRCDFVALLGDNVMPHGVSGIDDPQWQQKVEEPYGPLGVEIRPVLGNHDHEGDPDAQVRYSEQSEHWNMPARYYQFELGPVAFFALDTERFDHRQRRWLARGLRRSEATWNIVYGHHPQRSHGRHGPARGKLKRIGCIIERHADFYLSGHDHGQQVIQGQATYVVMGSGGSPPRGTKEGPDTQYEASRRGFGHLLIDDQRALLTVVEANGEQRFVREYPAEGAR